MYINNWKEIFKRACSL